MPDISVLNEHQAPREEAPKTSSAEQTPEELAAVRLAEKHYKEAKKARQKHDGDWGEFYRFLGGKQWKEKRPSYRHSEVINYIFSEVQTVIALLTDSRPRVDFLAQEPSDYQFAKIVSDVVSAKWDHDAWSAVVAECIFDALAIGTGVGYVPWVPEAKSGLGDFVFESEDPFYFYPSPNTKTKLNDDHCDYVVTAKPTPIEEVHRKYPDKKELVHADLTDLQSDYWDNDTGLDNTRLVSPTDQDMPTDGGGSKGSYAPNKVLVITDYCASYDEEECEVETGEVDPAGMPVKAYQTKKKYPNGRKIVTANGICLLDSENPYTEGRKPWGRLVDYSRPRTFWGTGEVEHTKSPQVIINKLVSYVLDVLILMGNPVWINPTDTGVDSDNLINKPGLVVEPNPGSQLQRLPGVDLPPYVIQVLDMFQERIWNKLTSSKEVSQGVQPTQNASGYQLELLQDAAQTKIRSKSRNLDVFLNEIGILMLDRILQFYTVPRIFRITNDEASSQYFKFSVSELDVPGPNGEATGQKQKIANIQRFNEDGQGGYVPANEVQQIPIKGSLDVKISTGSTLPFAKAQKAEKARELFKDGILDAEDYLTAIEWPGKEKVIQKYNERMQAQAQMQAQQQAMGGGPPGSPPPQGNPT